MKKSLSGVLYALLLTQLIVSCGSKDEEKIGVDSDGNCTSETVSDYNSVVLACSSKYNVRMTASDVTECNNKVEQFNSKYPSVSCKASEGYGLSSTTSTITNSKVTSMKIVDTSSGSRNTNPSPSTGYTPGEDNHNSGECGSRFIQRYNELNTHCSVTIYNSLSFEDKIKTILTCDNKIENFFDKYSSINCKAMVTRGNSSSSSQTINDEDVNKKRFFYNDGIRPGDWKFDKNFYYESKDRKLCGKGFAYQYLDMRLACLNGDQFNCQKKYSELITRYPKIDCLSDDIIFSEDEHATDMINVTNDFVLDKKQGV